VNVTIQKDSLQWLVRTASRPIPSRSTFPAIKGCLIEAISDRLVFSGTNLDWGVRVSAEAQVSSPGSVVVSSKILEDVVRTISTGEVNLSLDESAWALVVRAGSSEMVLNAVPADDFPKWPEGKNGEKVTLKADLFREMVRVGATSAVANPARPLWGACFLEFKDDRFVIVSTDQFALSRAVANVQGKEARAIISANVLSDIARLSDSENDDEIELIIAENHIYLSTKSMSCFSRLIEGQYYPYEQVIRKVFSSSARVPTESLLRAASRAAIVASEEDRAMRIILHKDAGTLTVKAGSPEKGRMEESFPAIINGEDVEIWVQHRYILQALDKIGTQDTFLGISGLVSPMKLEPVDDKEEEEGKAIVEATYVVMPMSSPKGTF
jgi:DNA polymerase-3 subunit beta